MNAVVYRFFNSAGDLLYIGTTEDFARRSAQHRALREWWPEVASHTIEEHSTRQAAEQAERAAIFAENPRYNVADHPQHRPRIARRRLHDGPILAMHEIAEYIGVSRQRASELTKTSEFPRPAARLKMGALWRTTEVVAWAEARGRVIHEAQEER